MPALGQNTRSSIVSKLNDLAGNLCSTRAEHIAESPASTLPRLPARHPATETRPPSPSTLWRSSGRRWSTASPIALDQPRSAHRPAWAHEAGEDRLAAWTLFRRGQQPPTVMTPPRSLLDPTSRGEGGVARLRHGKPASTSRPNVLADEARLVLGPWLHALEPSGRTCTG
jgi:hypothetical protein